MKIDKLHFENENWVVEAKECAADSVDIVFVFGEFQTIKSKNHTKLLKTLYPNAYIVGTSTSGNILDDVVSEYKAVASAVSFSKSKVAVNSRVIRATSIMEDAKTLIDDLDQDGLKHVFVLSQGFNMNTSLIVKGLNSDRIYPISGGIAADDNKFIETIVFSDSDRSDNLAVAIGFYGESLESRVGCKAGWDEFGAVRVVTRSEGNVVYEIDNKPALELYEKYLGEYIKDLPISGLLFPLNVRTNTNDKNEVIRVMMGINEDKSIVFAGEVPQDAEVRLMKTNIDNLIDSSSLVADSIEPYNDKRSLALTVSCTGRMSVLNQLADEEIEVIQNSLTQKTQVVGFYSYGEIAPFSDDLLDCKLHNQTMTITVIYED